MPEDNPYQEAARWRKAAMIIAAMYVTEAPVETAPAMLRRLEEDGDFSPEVIRMARDTLAQILIDQLKSNRDSVEE